MAERIWHVGITFAADGEHTRADAIVTLGGERIHGFGQARRAAGDPDIPVIGEELAASRALSDLAHQLAEAALTRIEA